MIVLEMVNATVTAACANGISVCSIPCRIFVSRLTPISIILGNISVNEVTNPRTISETFSNSSGTVVPIPSASFEMRLLPVMIRPGIPPTKIAIIFGNNDLNMFNSGTKFPSNALSIAILNSANCCFTP